MRGQPGRGGRRRALTCRIDDMHRARLN
jgi:hypothetical protein